MLQDVCSQFPTPTSLFNLPEHRGEQWLTPARKPPESRFRTLLQVLLRGLVVFSQYQDTYLIYLGMKHHLIPNIQTGAVSDVVFAALQSGSSLGFSYLNLDRKNGL